MSVRRVLMFVAVAVSLSSGPAGWTIAPMQADKKSPQKETQLYRDAMQMLRQGSYEAALNMFRELEQSRPHAPESYAGEGIALAMTGKPEDSIGALQKALAIDPQYAIARRELGIIEWQLGRKEVAAADLLKVVRNIPSDGPVSAILGEYYFEKGKYADSVAFFKVAHEQVSASQRLSLMYDGALIRVGHLEAAALQLDRLGATPNLTSEERFRIAWLYGKAKEYPRATAMFQSITVDFSDMVGRNYGLALAYYENGQNEDAIKLLDALKDRGVYRAEIYNLLGAAQEAIGQPEKAYDDFRSGIERFPNEESSYLNAATVAAQYRQYSAAEQIMTLGIKRISSNYKLFLTRGVIYTLWGDLNKAEADYRQSVSLAPNESSTQVALGICYMDKHQDADAVEVFRHAIHSGMEDVRLYYYLVDELFNQEITRTATFQEAMDAVNASIRFEPQFAYSYFQRGRLMLVKGQLESAISDFERARSLEPDSKDTAITYQLAIAYRDAGRKTEANRILSDISAAMKKQDDGYRYGTLVSVIGEESGSGFNEH